MRPVESGRGLSPRLRLQSVLLLMIVWDAVAVLGELSFGGPLFKISDGQIGGWLGARGAFGGIAVVPLVLYSYALVRGPMRYRGLLWVGVLEQTMAALFGVYHAALDDVKVSAAAAPVVVSLGLLVLLLTNMPREQTTS